MTELELTQLFEKYLNGEMSSQEAENFNQLIKENESVKQKFELHKAFIKTMKGLGRRQEIKTLLEQTSLDTTKPKTISFGKPYYAVAASLAGICLTIGSFFVGLNYSKQSDDSYQETSRKLKNIEAKQDFILKRINSSNAKTALEKANLSGTGFMVISPEYVITNYHLIKGADSIIVFNKSMEPVKASLVAQNSKMDLALLHIENSTSGKLPFSFRKKTAELGEEVFTIGFPREEMVYGEGSISSSSGYRGDSMAYQISIPVNPGNSGGPLLDNEGNIAGMISGKQTSSEGTGFAVKAQYIQEFLSPYIEEHKIKTQNKNTLKNLSRKDKIKKIKSYVVQIRVF